MKTTSDEPRGERDVFDVQRVGEKTSSRRHLLKDLFYGHNVLNLKPGFRVRHPWAWLSVFCVAVIAVIIGLRQFSTRADVQDFSPTTCLGNWQNVAAAEGRPETMGMPDIPFSAANSAIYVTGAEMYCGGFVPPTFATSGQITNVGLTLVWQIGDAPTSSAATFSETSTSTATDTDADSVATDTAAATTTDTNVTAPATLTPDDTSSDNAPSNVTPPAPPAPAPPSDPSSLLFIRNLVPLAFADDAVSGTVSTVASDTTATGTVASDTAEQPAPVPDENFLDVSYSTDGQTWVSVGKVNMGNWQQFTVTLPISNWNDLQNLQVRVEGIPTTQDPVPPVYLDGMFMEVHYDAPAPSNPADVASSTDETASSSASNSSSTPVRMTLVNPGAQQTCSVQPFSQALPLGGTAAFMVNLRPSINGVSYALLTGHLPSGISAVFSNPSGPIAATSSLVFQAETSTIPGSLNIVVIYRENEQDGSVLSNFCQLNVDVK